MYCLVVPLGRDRFTHSITLLCVDFGIRNQQKLSKVKLTAAKHPGFRRVPRVFIVSAAVKLSSQWHPELLPLFLFQCYSGLTHVLWYSLTFHTLIHFAHIRTKDFVWTANMVLLSSYFSLQTCIKPMCVFLPVLGKAVPLVLIHPEDISKWGDGRCICSEVDITMRPVVEQRDLRTKYKQAGNDTQCHTTTWQLHGARYMRDTRNNCNINLLKVHQNVNMIPQEGCENEKNETMKVHNCQTSECLWCVSC